MSSPSAPTVRVGSRVLCRWREGDYAFPGFVIRLEGDRVTVRYDDAEEETTSRAMLIVPAPRNTANRQWVVGERVWFRHALGTYWYVGTITSVEGEQIGVAAATGEQHQVFAERLAPFDLRDGSRVLARSAEGRFYYPATVQRIDGEQLTIKYDDGEQGQTSLVHIRVLRDEAVEEELPGTPVGPQGSSVRHVGQSAVSSAAHSSESQGSHDAGAAEPESWAAFVKFLGGLGNGVKVLGVFGIVLGAVGLLGLWHVFHRNGADFGAGPGSIDNSTVFPGAMPPPPPPPPQQSKPSVAVIMAMSQYRNRRLPPSPRVLEQFARLDDQSGMAYARAIGHDLMNEHELYLTALARVPKEDPWFGLAQAELKVANGSDTSAMLSWLAALDKRVAAPSPEDASRLPFLADLRGVCLQTTARLQRRNEQLVKRLCDAAAQPEPFRAAAAAAMLGSLGPEAAEAVPALARLLAHEVARVRLEATAALGEIGPAARQALPALERVAQVDPDLQVRARARQALRLIW